jgi:pimeloyl-ACP methyl ester carboxylesterase
MDYKICGDGPLMLLIPGLDGTGELFYRQLPELARDFTVATFALRAAGHFTYQDLVEDLAGLIEKLGKNSATICGESFGGTLTLQFALARPEMVERLVVINSFSYFRNRALLMAGRLLLDFTPFELIHFGRTIAVSLNMLAEDLPAEDKKRFLSITKKVNKLGVARRMELIAEYDLREQIGGINLPTLFIASRRDRLQNSVAEAQAMAARMPQAKIKIIEDMGHIPLPAPNFSLHAIFAEAGFLPEKIVRVSE